MNNWTEYIILIAILGGIVLSAVRGGRKRAEETAKTTLPGRKSGEVKLTQKKAPKKESPVSHLKTPTQHPSSSNSVEMPPVFEESENPVLDIENQEEIKRAFIYSEILNRKY
jgi:hypothetical protein